MPLIERQIESTNLRGVGVIVTKGRHSLPLFPNRHSLESPGVADISISYRSAEFPERIGCCQGTFPTLASAWPGYALESRQAVAAPSCHSSHQIECRLLADTQHKAILTTNHKPVVRGSDEGIWRRIHLVPFTVVIPERDVEKDFRKRRLILELAGIVNWALEGLSVYRKEGLNPPAVVRAATDDYRDGMDIIGQ